jgi:hypothetical protein
VYLGLLGLEWFDIVVPHFVLHILIVNFSWIVSASGCRHILPNHLNLGVFVAVLFLYSALFYFIVDLGIPHLSQQTLETKSFMKEENNYISFTHVSHPLSLTSF